MAYPISFFGEDCINTIKNIVIFKDNVEATALTLLKNFNESKDNILSTKNVGRRLSISPEGSNVILDPTKFTPPHSSRILPRIPTHNIYESGLESDDEDDNYKEYYNQKADEYGYVRIDDG